LRSQAPIGASAAYIRRTDFVSYSHAWVLVLVDAASAALFWFLAWILVCVGRWVAAGFWQPAPVSERKPKDWMAPGAFRERHKVMWRNRQFRSMRRVASTVGTIEPLRPREHP